MFPYRKRHSLGFTLIEMAIVLGVAGILFGGLWRLLSNGNAQMRDQATAAQHSQMINAVSGYLQSPGLISSPTGGGQAFLAGIAANNIKSLTLPPVGSAAGTAACLTALAASNPGLCNFLPPGFTVATANPYGQTYSIGVLKDATAAGSAPQSYSFMVLTSGGDVISDTSGGRISAAIGGDGGFIYSSNVCGTPTANACGAYGAWSTPIAYAAGSGYFNPPPTIVGGQVASRTFYSPSQNLSDKWLARVAVSGDTGFKYNTMSTPLYLGEQGTYFGTSSSDTITAGEITAGGGTLYMQSGKIVAGSGGTISADGATIDLGTSGIIQNLSSGGTGSVAGGYILLNGNLSTTNGGNPNSLLTLNSSSCSKSSPSDNTCNFAETVNGSTTIRDGLLVQGFLYSNSFVYNGSDIRLKTNVQPLQNPLADLMKLKPVSFAYKNNGRETMGIIAQDLEKVYPQLVADGPTGLKSVSYDGLISPLIGSVQQLKAENDNLRALLKEQDARQDRLEQELRDLRTH